MNRVLLAKNRMDELLKIQSELSKFHEKKVTPQLRIDLCNYLKKLTTQHGIIREDENKVVRLWTSNVYKNNGMSSDIEIYGASGTFYVITDSLWRTIKGLDEIVRGD